jgi:hypothetical protein
LEDQVSGAPGLGRARSPGSYRLPWSPQLVGPSNAWAVSERSETVPDQSAISVTLSTWLAEGHLHVPESACSASCRLFLLLVSVRNRRCGQPGLSDRPVSWRCDVACRLAWTCACASSRPRTRPLPVSARSHNSWRMDCGPPRFHFAPISARLPSHLRPLETVLFRR